MATRRSSTSSLARRMPPRNKPCYTTPTLHLGQAPSPPSTSSGTRPSPLLSRPAQERPRLVTKRRHCRDADLAADSVCGSGSGDVLLGADILRQRPGTLSPNHSVAPKALYDLVAEQWLLRPISSPRRRHLPGQNGLQSNRPGSPTGCEQARFEKGNPPPPEEPEGHSLKKWQSTAAASARAAHFIGQWPVSSSLRQA
jgi:hypothetical protein